MLSPIPLHTGLLSSDKNGLRVVINIKDPSNKQIPFLRRLIKGLTTSSID